MYSEINTLIRKEINSKSITYKGSELEHVRISKQHTEDGPYVQVSTELADPVSQEVGFDASQNISGFIQFLVKLPESDTGLDYYVNEIAQQYFVAFPAQSKTVDGLTIEYLPVGRPLEGREAGYYTVTVRVGFNIYYCV
ncbi:hypothetical protein NVP1176O_13 [Vibrio phage 1.176.O._10N.261.55.F5]|nr:hypothetical protein NVP1176O_13 [Vibrio phage 1.176.O._10N.261.55.F5]